MNSEDPEQAQLKVQDGGKPLNAADDNNSPDLQSSALGETAQDAGTEQISLNASQKSFIDTSRLDSPKSVAPGNATPRGAATPHQQEPDQEEDDETLNVGLFEIEASTAFKFLEDLKSKKILDIEKVEDLRNRHRSLYEYLLTAFDYEKIMLKKATALQFEVTKQKLQMDQIGSKLYEDNAEIGELKRDLLRCQNEVALAQEREEKYAKDIEEAVITKESLLEDIEEIRRHKSDMLEPQLIANTKEIKLELSQRKHQADNLETDLEEKEHTRDNIFKDRERLVLEQSKQEDMLLKASETPGKIMKQAEVLRDGIASLVIENMKQNQLSIQYDKDGEKLIKKRKDLEDEKSGLVADLEARKEGMQAQECECDTIFREHGLAKEQLLVQESEKIRLKLEIKHVEQQTKSDYEAWINCGHEKEHLVKYYHKLENTVNSITASLAPAKQKNSDMHVLLNVAERDAKHFRAAVRDIRRQCDVLMHAIIEGERVSTTDKEKLASRIEGNRQIEQENEKISEELKACERQTVQVCYEREMRAREALRIETKYRKVRDDLARREIELQDSKKKASEAVTRLNEFATLYDTMKADRNRYVNMIASSQQSAMEMKEKSRILRSEVEVLQSEIVIKDKELAKKRQDNNAAYSKRDNLKMDANRFLVQYREKRGLIDQQAGRIDTLSNSLASCANELTALKTRYSQVVAARNALGVQYLERNDELCMLYEKNNIHKRTMKTGEEELTSMDDRIRELTRLHQELERTVRLRRKKLPRVRAIVSEYEALRAQVKESKLQVLELSKVMETPTSERVRDLKGTDPTPEQLATKVRRLELRLAHQEEKILEKDLVLEEINHLTERLRKETFSGRNESAEVLSRTNKASRKLSKISRDMMALVAELSGAQVLATALEHEVSAKSGLLNDVRNALDDENPGPAIPDFEAEWARIESRRERRLELAQQNRQRELGLSQEGEWTLLADHARPTYLLPDGTKTIANPRPNAYLPTLPEALPVAKPYGAKAPFKSTQAFMTAQAGGNLKYYRKPVYVPLEL